MNRADLQQTGGLPLETDTLSFLQDSFTLLQEMVALGGDNYILSGCIVNGSNAGAGHVVIDGELLPFVGGLIQSKVVIRETVSKRLFESGANKDVYRTRVAQFGTGDPFVLWNNLARIKDLKTFRSLPHQSSDSVESDSVETLATSKAVKTLHDLLKNQVPAGVIVIWNGSIDSIPVGWGFCDGQDGRPDLRDRFVLGAGNLYGLRDTGGEREHILSETEMPSHSHTIDVSSAESGNWRADGGSGKPIAKVGGIGTGVADPAQIGNTKNKGGGQAHNNMPPFYSLAYIIKL